MTVSVADAKSSRRSAGIRSYGCGAQENGWVRRTSRPSATACRSRPPTSPARPDAPVRRSRQARVSAVVASET